MRYRLSIHLTLLAGSLIVPALASAEQSCESLASMKIPHVTITLATTITPAPEYAAPNPKTPMWSADPIKVSVPFCRIAGYSTPAGDSHIGFEVWLPRADHWNGKYLGIGSPGFVGYIAYRALARNMQKGYATASTDSGHVDVDTPGEAPTSAWGGIPDKVIDWGHRGQHETTVIAKQIAKAYYGTTIKYAYWNSCHEGGNQALTELQRYPEDFDGIVAGDPAYYITRLQTVTEYVTLTLVGDGPDTPTYFPQGKYAVLHRAVLDACDALDGVRDNIIDDPTFCHFDPKTIQCPAYRDEPSCLTAAQVETVKKVYGGGRFADGTEIYPGYEPGSELRWDFLGRGPGPFRASTGFFANMVYPNQNWDYHTFELDRAARDAAARIGSMVDFSDPNLQPFRDRGGKVIMYAAWEESAIPPRGLVNYYQSVVDTMGGLEQTQNFAHLFMPAGLGMCPGFSDPDSFDSQKAIELWVEQGQAPDTIMGKNKVGDVVHRTRPVCAWPKVAIYQGNGDTNDAANFSCGMRQ
ncbi:MAG: Tannase/feruloyl esterase family alpha/beta hydrolase [Gammaproteobacteria bacterium]|nr:Tannase/feruloyl esterase family alpha/beta hydrolase [Gammaproteobacteria bacterium]